MKETDIRRYAGLMRELGLTGLEITEDNKVVRLERNTAPQDMAAPRSPVPQAAKGDSVPERGISPDSESLLSVKSPMVGVFYASPAENAPPYVSAGDRVSKGQVLCIIEAMKLMNEIVAEEDGIVEEVCVTNGQIVEYGTELFRFRR